MTCRESEYGKSDFVNEDRDTSRTHLVTADINPTDVLLPESSTTYKVQDR